MTFEELLEEARNNATLGGSLIAAFLAKKSQLDDLLSGVVIPPATQAKIDELFTITKADSEALATALLENTPEGKAKK